jgi:hypothetical protein
MDGERVGAVGVSTGSDSDRVVRVWESLALPDPVAIAPGTDSRYPPQLAN